MKKRRGPMFLERILFKARKATGNISEYLDNPEKLIALGVSGDEITRLIKRTGNLQRYIIEGKKTENDYFELDVVDLIRGTGRIEEYLTLERIKQFGLDKTDIIYLIEATGRIEEYLTPERIKQFGLDEADIIYLIEATGRIEEYLTPERILQFDLQGKQIKYLISKTGKVEKYLFEWQDKNDPRLQLILANVIKAIGRIEEYLIPEKIIQFYPEERWFAGNGREECFETITNLIKATGQIEKYLFEGQDKNDPNLQLNFANLIKGTGRIEEYLTPERILQYYLRNEQIDYLIKATGQMEKYLFEGQDKNDPNLQLNLANVVKATGRIEEYLIPEIILQYELDGMLKKDDIVNLIKATGQVEKYLFEGQDKNDPNLQLNLANVIKATGRIEEYLIPEIIVQFYPTWRWFNERKRCSEEITNLIKATGEIEKYLFEGQDKNDPNLQLDLANVIKATGKIEEYLTPERISEYGSILRELGIVDLINEIGKKGEYLTYSKIKEFRLEYDKMLKAMNPELEEKDLNAFREFGFGRNTLRYSDLELIWNTLINIEIQKQKNAILVLDRVSSSNSGELRRVRVPMTLQILRGENEEYNELLNKIEEIYLTNNIPTVGKLYLVFQELHPNFLGEESNQMEDDSYANIPSLNVMNKDERKHIIFSDLLMCSLESNNRNIRDYLDTIEQGNILYEQILSGELNLDELDSKDEKIEILSKYRDILNALYNVTSKGKRKGNFRTTSENLENNLKELDALFGEDLIEMNLPDRIIRTFAFGTGIRTLEQAKNIIEKTRENAHNRNVQVAKKGKIELKPGDYVKGIQDTEYFSSMLQRGILAKDFLGENATYDATPLDTDVRKILKEGKSFEKMFSDFESSYINRSENGKKLGTIHLVFSGDNFIETRDALGKINEGNIELLKTNRDKKEVFSNNRDFAYGIRTGIGSANIKCIVADRYVDKLGLEIAKNGFYIPIVNKEGTVIFTEKMYNEFREKMQGLSHYDENKFIVDDTARNEGTRQIAELVDKIKQDAQSKREKILKTLEEAVKQSGYIMSEERKSDLRSGVIDFIDSGSTGRGTNIPGDGDFDFIVRMDKKLSDVPQKFKEALREVLRKIRNPKESTETTEGQFRYKGVSIEGLDKEVDIDLTFIEKTDEIEYSTDESIKERLRTIESQSLEDYRYVVANILLAKMLLKQANVYKKANAPVPEAGKRDTRGGLGAVGIENWVLQNGGSFYKAAESFLKVANKSKDFDEFRSKYSVWDFGENYMSTQKNIYSHDNFVDNMTEDGYIRMKEALARYIEAVKKENSKQDEKIGIVDIIAQDTSVINDTPYMIAVKAIMAKGKELGR